MKAPDALWLTEYRADRRKHHHRCLFCNRILKDGEAAVHGWKMNGQAVVVAHEACAAEPLHGSPGYLKEDAMRYWSLEGLIRKGYYNLQHEADRLRIDMRDAGAVA